MFGAALGGDYSLWVRTMKQLNWLPKIAINYCTGYQNPAVQKELGDDGNFFMGGMGFSPELAKKFMPEAIKVQDKYYTREATSRSTATPSRKPSCSWFSLRR